MLFIYCSIPYVNICMPTSVDHYVTTNSLKAGWISQLVVLTLGFAEVREASISFVSQIYYHSNVLAIGYREHTTHSEPVSKQVPEKISR